MEGKTLESRVLANFSGEKERGRVVMLPLCWSEVSAAPKTFAMYP
jgi:hypothetical protein